MGTEEQGVLYSIDNGDNWIDIGEGLPSSNGSFSEIYTLAVGADGYLYVGTFQNGAYRSINSVISVYELANLPKNYSLSQNYPNPFNPTTTISYTLPTSVNCESAIVNSVGTARELSLQTVNVELKIYDILGREIAILVNEMQKPGNYEITWEADNYQSGIYFYKLNVGDFSQTRKMILLK